MKKEIELNITKNAIDSAKIDLKDINLIAVTYGSGLLSSLIIFY